MKVSYVSLILLTITNVHGRKSIIDHSSAEATFAHITRTQRHFEKPSNRCHVDVALLE